MRTLTAIALTLSLPLAIAGCAQADDQLTRTEVEEIVRSYLLENPEMLREMSAALQEKEEREMNAMTADILKDYDDRITGDPRDIKIGPDDAKVTVVEFFDYNCGFCKQSTDWVRKVIEDHPEEVQVVFKEVPVLDRGRPGGSSRNAAKAALAAAKQGKYLVMHLSLMNERALTPERIEKLAELADLDMEKFKSDMADPALDVHINQNLQLSREIPALGGTPFFIVNDQWVSGANLPELERMLEEELAG